MNKGCAVERMFVSSVALPRRISVYRRPVVLWCTMSSPSGSGAPSGRAMSTLDMLSCRSLSVRSSRSFPPFMMPTWSHTSSSSRRLCDETSTVVPFSATSAMTRLHACRRMTGSSPSTGSSRISTSGRMHIASQKAACFCMPFDRRRIGRFGSSANTAPSFSYRSASNRG